MCLLRVVVVALVPVCFCSLVSCVWFFGVLLVLCLLVACAFCFTLVSCFL